MESKHRCVDARLEIVVLLVSKQTLMPLKWEQKEDRNGDKLHVVECVLTMIQSKFLSFEIKNQMFITCTFEIQQHLSCLSEGEVSFTQYFFGIKILENQRLKFLLICIATKGGIQHFIMRNCFQCLIYFSSTPHLIFHLTGQC